MPANDPTTGSAPRFPLGQTVMTRAAELTLDPEDMRRAIARHHAGDWGDVCPDDQAANEAALEHGDRLFSIYHSRTGVKFYVITEHDRSITTVLLPEDY
jgi:hypothetical protein